MLVLCDVHNIESCMRSIMYCWNLPYQNYKLSKAKMNGLNFTLLCTDLCVCVWTGLTCFIHIHVIPVVLDCYLVYLTDDDCYVKVRAIQFSEILNAFICNPTTVEWSAIYLYPICIAKTCTSISITEVSFDKSNLTLRQKWLSVDCCKRLNFYVHFILPIFNLFPQFFLSSSQYCKV